MKKKTGKSSHSSKARNPDMSAQSSPLLPSLAQSSLPCLRGTLTGGESHCSEESPSIWASMTHDGGERSQLPFSGVGGQGRRLSLDLLLGGGG